MRRLVAARLVLSKGGRDKSRPTKAVTSYRTPNSPHSSDSLTTSALPFWSALTCQRFVTRRLVAARLPIGSIWPRPVAAYQSGNKLPHSKFAAFERFDYNISATLLSPRSNLVANIFTCHPEYTRWHCVYRLAPRARPPTGFGRHLHGYGRDAPQRPSVRRCG